MKKRIENDDDDEDEDDSEAHRKPQTHQPTDPQTRKPTDLQVYRPTNPQTHEPTDPRTHRPTDPRTHRPTDPRTHKPLFAPPPRKTTLVGRRCALACSPTGGPTEGASPHSRDPARLDTALAQVPGGYNPLYPSGKNASSGLGLLCR